MDVGDVRLGESKSDPYCIQESTDEQNGNCHKEADIKKGHAEALGMKEYTSYAENLIGGL